MRARTNKYFFTFITLLTLHLTFLADAGIVRTANCFWVELLVEIEAKSIIKVAIWRIVIFSLFISRSVWETQLSCSLFALFLWCYPFTSGSACNYDVLAWIGIFELLTKMIFWCDLIFAYSWCLLIIVIVLPASVVVVSTMGVIVSTLGVVVDGATLLVEVDGS